jgi:hypothetical protein
MRRDPTRVFWSDQHEKLLRTAAQRVLRRYHGTCGLSLRELMNEGWLRCLRLRPENRLKGCFSFLLAHMSDYAEYVRTGQSIFKRNQTPGRKVRNVSDLSDWVFEAIADPHDYFQRVDDLDELEVALPRCDPQIAAAVWQKETWIVRRERAYR